MVVILFFSTFKISVILYVLKGRRDRMVVEIILHCIVS